MAHAIQLDRRSRLRSDVVATDAPTWFRSELPTLLDERGEMAAAAVARFDLPPITLTVDGERFGLSLVDGELTPGPSDGGVQITLSTDAFSDWIRHLRSVIALTVSGSMAVRGNFEQALVWERVLRTLTDGVPVHEPGSIAFVDRHGQPLELDRCFTPDDDPADVAHFLRAAGFLHLRGWLDADMDLIAAEMDLARGRYHSGDGRSWWATLDSGDEVCVRMQWFADESPETARLLASDSFDRLRQVIAGDETLIHRPAGENTVEGLFKPLGVRQGISDVPWHRDCAFGGHPFDCSGVTVGISVTEGAADSGMLRVVAGSHRAATIDLAEWSGNDLPIRELATEQGDLTVHVSCTIHEALPPTARPRKVLYTGFRLPPREAAPPPASDRGVNLRENAYRVTSQPANETRR